MSSTMTTARHAGALYLVFSIIAVIGEYAFPAFVNPGDAAVTAHNITNASCPSS